MQKATPSLPRSETRGTLRARWRQSPPSRFLDYKDFLRSLLDAAEKELGRYSYLQYSQDLGFPSHNVAYFVIHGMRKLSPEQADTITTTLGITGPERRYFLKLIDYTDCRHEAERQDHFQALAELKEQIVESPSDRLMLRFFREWHHAAIFELVDLPEFKADPEWIAGCFYKRLTPEQVTRSLELLTELGLVKRDEATGALVKVKKSVSTGDEVRGMAAVGYHLQMISLGQSALSQVPAAEREIGALTLALDDSALARLKEDLRLFRKYAVFLSEQCENPGRIVQLNFQLFPMTRS